MTRHEAFLRVVGRVAAELGEEVARAVLRLFVAEAGGERMVIPDEHDFCLQERNRRIRERYRGHNAEELALRYGLTVRQVRNIISN